MQLHRCAKNEVHDALHMDLFWFCSPDLLRDLQKHRTGGAIGLVLAQFAVPILYVCAGTQVLPSPPL